MKPTNHTVSAKPISSISVLGARMTWVCLGPAALFFAVLGITYQGTGWLTLLDAFFWLVVGLMMLGRWVEFRAGAATTLTGEPTTQSQYRTYMAWFPAIAALLWAVANALGNHLLN